MCGILGIVSTAPLSISDREACRLRDLMHHRGPDGAGLWRGGGLGGEHGPGTVLLAHRRLAVVDLSVHAAQPMRTGADFDGERFVLVYNGELYNDGALRTALGQEGVRFRTSCDAETLLYWLATRGAGGVPALRGMYAFGLYDRQERRLLLARDPLGIKPLYWWIGREGGMDLLIFASEPRPIVEHPAVRPEPDLVGVSGYLTTIRTVLGERTMFAGVHALPPGRVVEVDCRGERLTVTSRELGIGRVDLPASRAERLGVVRGVVEGSVGAHLRSDVPTCCLLSGGLDSAIITTVARRHDASLRTYCSGCPGDEDTGLTARRAVPPEDDFVFAREVAAGLGTTHTEAPVDGAMFLSRWREMVAAQGTPLSTPNEVAINEVARRLRADGCVVTLSGEGADELFGGYDHTLRPAAAHIAAGNADPGLLHLRLAAWCTPEAKAGLLQPAAWAELEGDAWLRGWYAGEFEAAARGDEPLADHLRFQRRVNLTGLLGRLDTATMLASVEGRTPFADGEVAAVAESLPMADRFIAPDRTKIALREAFGAVLPAGVVRRAKASFPLPFQRWLAGMGETIGGSALLAELLTPAARSAVAADPGTHWRLAWPLANLALWGEVWWPSGVGVRSSSRRRWRPVQEELAGAIAAGGPSPTVSSQ
jgi:asparagine synthase (glutamine-hydrolysing)